MSRHNSDGQTTLEPYQTIEQTDDGWRCGVCKHECEEKSVIEHCHPPDRVAQSRHSGGVTANTDTHQGFVLPPQLHPDVKELFRDIKAAVQDLNVPPHAAASTVLADTLSETKFPTEAQAAYGHLVFCQQHQLLPGYPQPGSTGDETRPSLQKYCSETDQFAGTVTDSDIAAMDEITTERVYRRKVRTTTPDFLITSQVLPDSLWAWETTYEFDDLGLFTTNLVFGDKTSHNLLATEARDWVVTHPSIDWACAPHVMTIKYGNQEFIPANDPDSSPPTPDPVTLFDFAGFCQQRQQRLAVLGFVVEGGYQELLDRLLRRIHPHAECVVVFPTRDAIINFIDELIEKGPVYDSATVTGTVEHCDRQPNISAVNEAITDRLNMFESTTFITRKQLIDGVIDPTQVLPEQLPPEDG
jgi:hypothetical protein